MSGSTMKSRLLRETLIILALFSALIVVSGLITAREVDEELIARRTQNLGDYVAMLEYSMRSFPGGGDSDQAWSRFLEALHVQNSGSLLLISDSGEVLFAAHSDKPGQKVGETLKDFDPTRHRRATMTGKSDTYFDSATSTFTAYIPLPAIHSQGQSENSPAGTFAYFNLSEVRAFALARVVHAHVLAGMAMLLAVAILLGLHHRSVLNLIRDLTKSEELYRSVVSNAPICIHGVDRKGRITSMNPAGLLMLGLDREEEVLGTPYTDLVVPEDREILASNIEQSLQGKSCAFEYQLQGVGGLMSFQSSLNPVKNRYGEVASLIGASMDVTVAKRAASIVRESEQKYRGLFDHAQVSIWIEDFSYVHSYMEQQRQAGVKDFRSHLAEHPGLLDELVASVKVLQVNPATLVLYGAASSEQFIDSILKVFGPGALDRFADGLFAIWEGEEIFQCESTQRRLTGEYFAAAISMPIPKADADFACVPVSILDLSPLRRMESDLRRKNQLESIGTLAGGIAHDFNNLLTVIIGSISLARASLAAEDAAVKFLDGAQGALGRATNLSQQLLTFAKGGAPITEVINIVELVFETVRLELVGSAVELEFDCSAEDIRVMADKAQIQQALSNLTVNALQAMPGGGRLRVELELETSPVSAEPDAASETAVLVRFCDQGTGIAESDKERIFEPYYSTKKTGSGLGLATTYSIVSRHGGHIEVDSTVGKGSTFTIYLPVVSMGSAPVDKVQPPEPESEPLKVGPRVLLMDDNESILTTVTMLLESFGCTVETAEEGLAAIEIYRQSVVDKRPFDCVILDLVVPGGMGGEEAIQGILEVDPDARVIVSSGYSDSPVMARAGKYGFHSVLSKPFTLQLLKEAVYRAIA